jgi:transmembrane sensor
MPSSKLLKTVLERVKKANTLDVEGLQELNLNEKTIITELYESDLVDEAIVLIDDLDSEEDWKIIKERVSRTKRTGVPLWKQGLKYAAIVLGLVFSVYLFMIEKEAKKILPENLEESITLKTGSDDIEVIREGESQQIVSASGLVVGKQDGNTIRYDYNSAIEELVYNELEIPYGKIFNVELSDGTIIHLNSGSKLRYPINFLKGQKREVFIEGEAYFVVAKDKDHPFVVHADGVGVNVLGTEFNVSSYKEDNEIKTVLVEGSVSLSDPTTLNPSVILKPGQKAAWNKTDLLTDIEDVDVNLYSSWITGEMIFRDVTFADMAIKLERRYNVKIKNNNKILKGKILNARFNVEVETIEEVLYYINEIQPFNFTISGQKITIT